MEIDRKRDGVKDKRRRRVGLALETIPIVIGCHRKAGSPREKKSRVPRGRGEGRVTRSTGGGPGAPLWALPRRWRYYRKLPPSKEERPRCSIAGAERSRSIARCIAYVSQSRFYNWDPSLFPSSSPFPCSLVHSSVFLFPSFFTFHRVHFSSFHRESPSLDLVHRQTKSKSRDVPLFLPMSAACNTVIGQFRGFPFE